MLIPIRAIDYYRTLISKGNIIGPQSNSLARIVELNPIYVNFNVAEGNLISIRLRALNKTGNNRIKGRKFRKLQYAQKIVDVF